MSASTVRTAVTLSRRGPLAGTTYHCRLELDKALLTTGRGAGGDGVVAGTKKTSPEDLRCKPLKSHSKVKETFGSECNCEGDGRHPGGCKGVRIGL